MLLFDPLQSHFLPCLTLHQPHCIPGSLSLQSCLPSLLLFLQVPSFLITIKVFYQIQKSVTLLDGLLYNRFLFNLSNTVVVVPEEKKTRNRRALAFYLFLTYGTVHEEVSFYP